MPRSRVFVSYSHANRDWFDKFKAFLKAIDDTGIDVWSDHDIPTGARWRDEIEAAIADTRVALLLVTQDFLASDFIKSDELAPFLEAAASGEVTIYAVAVKHSTYTLSPLNDLQFFNDPAQPLESLSDSEQNAELTRLATAIVGLVRQSNG